MRKTISKRTRFEIFKRDGFKCVHCGNTPNDSTLHLDHLAPLAEGGSDEAENLVTSCAACNLGKGPVPLNRLKLKKGKATEADLEHAEQLREWLRIQQDVALARDEVADMLADEWDRRIGGRPRDIATRLKSQLGEFSAEKLFEAMDITGRKRGGRGETEGLMYFYGVLRRWRREASGQPNSPGPELGVAPPKNRHVLAADEAIFRAVREINGNREAFGTNLAIQRRVFEEVYRAISPIEGDPVAPDEWLAILNDPKGGALPVVGVLLECSSANKEFVWRARAMPGFDPCQYALTNISDAVTATIIDERVKEHQETCLPVLERAAGRLSRLQDWIWYYDLPDEVP